jgi:hypothetical protein
VRISEQVSTATTAPAVLDTKKISRLKKSKFPSIEDGTVVFVRADSWSRYERKWPYPYNMEIQYAYFRGNYFYMHN